MEKIKLDLTGCFQLRPEVKRDSRGTFVKTWQRVVSENLKIKFTAVEEFHTISHQGVLRGLHFQLPPSQYRKLAGCIYGRVFDVIVDLRKGSPTYGQYQALELDGDDGSILYLPPGIAHGFYARSEPAIMTYKIDQEYSMAHDTGIKWNSLPIPWPDKQPEVSARDQALPAWEEFASPFIYQPEDRDA